MRFDGTIENRNPPIVVSQYDVLQEVENVNVEIGKESVLEDWAKRQQGVNHAKLNTQTGQKKSIFLTSLLVRPLITSQFGCYEY